MEIQKYLENLRTRKDKSLETELGIYDNYAICMRTSFNNILDYFRNSLNWAFSSKKETLEKKSYNSQSLLDELKIKEKGISQPVFCFNYLLAPVISHIDDYKYNFYTTFGEDDPEVFKAHQQRILNNYNLFIMFHPDKHRDISIKRHSDLEQYIDIAKAVVEVGEFIVREKIPVVFPHSYPRATSEFSKIVYYEPEL